MTITRAPKSKLVDVAQVINKGGSSPKSKTYGQEERQSILLKLPARVIEQIREAIEDRPVRVSRQTWIEETIIEKLTKKNFRKRSS